MMTTTIIPQIITSFTIYNKPTNSFSFTNKWRNLCCCYHKHRFVTFESTERFSLLYFNQNKPGFFEKNKKRVVNVRSNNNNLKFNNGGGKDDDGGTSKVLVNVALAIGLAYLSFTGQLGWILDAIVSLWLFAVLVPLVGFVALIWWASRDMVEIQCRNCGNEFEVFKSMLDDEPQVCPYCSQPFSVVGDEFIRDPTEFSKKSTTFDGAFNDLFTRTKKGKASSRAVIDVEAEVKDVD